MNKTLAPQIVLVHGLHRSSRNERETAVTDSQGSVFTTTHVAFFLSRGPELGLELEKKVTWKWCMPSCFSLAKANPGVTSGNWGSAILPCLEGNEAGIFLEQRSVAVILWRTGFYWWNTQSLWTRALVHAANKRSKVSKQSKSKHQTPSYIWMADKQQTNF